MTLTDFLLLINLNNFLLFVLMLLPNAFKCPPLGLLISIVHLPVINICSFLLTSFALDCCSQIFTAIAAMFGSLYTPQRLLKALSAQVLQAKTLNLLWTDCTETKGTTHSFNPHCSSSGHSRCTEHQRFGNQLDIYTRGAQACFIQEPH